MSRPSDFPQPVTPRMLTPEGVATLVRWEARAAEIREEDAAEAAKQVNEEWANELVARRHREVVADLAMAAKHAKTYRADQPYSPPFWRNARLLADVLKIALIAGIIWLTLLAIYR